VRAVVENLDIPKTVADPKLREQIEKDIADMGLAAVFTKLVALDPEAAYVVDPKNPRRVVRALEVALATGVPFTAQRTKRAPLFDALTLGLNPAPELLRERIDRRVDAMMRDGLVHEVAILTKKYGKTPIAFDAIGYREIINSLNGERSIEAAAAAIKINTWYYAKRQMTWFKKYKTMRWVENEQKATVFVREFLGV
jgi:tRNA dimethylallyltransferase